jgi:hypothetical protein
MSGYEPGLAVYFAKACHCRRGFMCAFCRSHRPRPQLRCVDCGDPPDDSRCDMCGAPLRPHNLTRLCAECKLVARNQRLTVQPVGISESVTEAQALANLAEALGAHPIGST